MIQEKDEANSKMTWKEVVGGCMSGRPCVINESPKCDCYAFMEDNKNGQQNRYKIHR